MCSPLPRHLLPLTLSFSLHELTGGFPTCGPKFSTVNLPFFAEAGQTWGEKVGN